MEKDDSWAMILHRGKVTELTETERYVLAIKARHTAEEYIDYRFYQDLTLDERWIGYNRWYDIADALHPNPWLRDHKYNIRKKREES